MHDVTFTHVGKSIDLLKHKEYLCRLKPKYHHGVHAVDTHGESRDLLKHLSSKVDLLDYKAHDHNKIMHRERDSDEHIATGRALALRKNYSLLIMGISNGDGDR